MCRSPGHETDHGAVGEIAQEDGGALGSRKTHQRRVERLREAGIAESVIGRIDAPIGADIGAATPGEIAVAIMASVIEAFRKRKMFAERRGEEAAA